jgi:hypothetical protein
MTSIHLVGRNEIAGGWWAIKSLARFHSDNIGILLAECTKEVHSALRMMNLAECASEAHSALRLFVILSASKGS